MAVGVEVDFNSTRWPLALIASSVLHWICKHIFILTRYYGLKPLHSFHFCLRTLMSCQQTYLKLKHKRKSPMFTHLLFYNESWSIVRHISICEGYTVWNRLPVDVKYFAVPWYNYKKWTVKNHCIQNNPRIWDAVVSTVTRLWPVGSGFRFPSKTSRVEIRLILLAV